MLLNSGLLQKGWLLLFFSGVIAVGLGYWMYTRTGEEALEIIGILAGIDFLLTGISMLAIAITVRQLIAIGKDASKQASQNQNSDTPLVD